MRRLGVRLPPCASLVLGLAASACSRQLIRLEAAGQVLRVIPAPGVRINARLKPALELTNGRVLRFDSPALTPDSSYFSAPPEVLLEANPPVVRGVLRASICPAGEAVCRTVSRRVP